MRAIKKETPAESLGTIGSENGHLKVIEYSENPGDGELGNTALFSCTLAFAQKAAKAILPYHIAKKTLPNTLATIYKFETFILDLFPLASTYRVLLSSRKKCFAPIKTKADLNEAEQKIEMLLKNREGQPPETKEFTPEQQSALN